MPVKGERLTCCHGGGETTCSPTGETMVGGAGEVGSKWVLGTTGQGLPARPARPTTAPCRGGHASLHPCPSLELKHGGQKVLEIYLPTSIRQNPHIALEGGLGAQTFKPPQADTSFTHGLLPSTPGFGNFWVSWLLNLGFQSPVALYKEVAGSTSHSGLSFLINTHLPKNSRHFLVEHSGKCIYRNEAAVSR